MVNVRIAALVLLITSSVLTPGARADSLSLAVQKFRLANGLTVVLHEDHLTPAVAIQLGFRVGSRHEPKGRSEFAHLVEHLMNGPSLNDNAQRAESLRKVGGLFINASTFPDYSIYYATVPTHALDAALWIEADRMANLLPAVEQSALDAQRMSVMNERREKDEDQPYGAARRLLARHLYPPAHPYHHIGNDYREDLREVNLTDLQPWVNSRHGASNAVLVLTGDIDLESAKLKVEKYFGHILPGPPPDAQETVWTPRMNEPKRVLTHDRVTQTRVYAAWNVAPAYTAGAINLAIAAKILAGGPGTRLHDRMVVRDRITTQASASLDVQALSSQFVTTLTAAGAPAARLEEVLNEELRRFIESGPSDDELTRARAKIRLEKAQEVRYLYGKARALGIAELVMGNADSYEAELQHLQAATPQSVTEAAKRWLVT